MIPCEQNPEIRSAIVTYADTLMREAHTLGTHGLSETDFYQGGVFRGAIERIRGQFSAAMREKREFVRAILDDLKDKQLILAWASAGERNRHDYSVELLSGKTACIELKGCLDGNNTNIFERPPNADEFVIWSICTNPAADPRHNVWSGIHTRLSAEIIEGGKAVDGVIVWDWLCGTISRPCPKLNAFPGSANTVGPYRLPPPCIYLFPKTVPSPRNNPSPEPQSIEGVELLKLFHEAYCGTPEYLHSVRFSVGYSGTDVVRKTTILRNETAVRESDPNPIRRR